MHTVDLINCIYNFYFALDSLHDAALLNFSGFCALYCIFFLTSLASLNLAHMILQSEKKNCCHCLAPNHLTAN